MNSNWKEYNLGQIVDLLTKKVNGSTIDLSNYISTENMLPEKGGITISSGLPKQDNFLEFRIGDVLFSNIRTYFKKVWQATFNGGASNDVIVFRTRDKKILDQSFLYYLIASDSFISHTVRTAKGTKMPRGDKDAIKKFKFYIPEDIEEQKSIAKTLNCLDDKISNNNHINQTLEEIAQALFKSWFVDFEPIKAKMQAKIEGADQQLAAMMAISGKTEEEILQLPEENLKELAKTAALFPDDFEESELGMIPEGWKIYKLGNITAFLSRGLTPTYANSGVAVINQRCIRNQTIDFSNIRFHDENLREVKSKEAFVGDILINSTGVGTLGRVAIIKRLEQRSTVDTHITIVRANSTVVNPNYLGYFLLSKESIIEEMGEGSTGQTELKRAVLFDMDICLPNLNVQNRFSDIVSQVISNVSNNEIENQRLVLIRNLLIYKLLSSQLAIEL
jgi:type I restriction enzyme, S subunit